MLPPPIQLLIWQELSEASSAVLNKEAGKFQLILAFCVVATIPYPPGLWKVAMGVAAHNSGVAYWYQDG